MKSLTDQTTFVNGVSVIGGVNGVINLDLATLIFSPSQDGQSVTNEMAVAVRLRMDRRCAEEIRDLLGTWLQKMDTAAAAATNTNAGLAGPVEGEKTH